MDPRNERVLILDRSRRMADCLAVQGFPCFPVCLRYDKWPFKGKKSPNGSDLHQFFHLCPGTKQKRSPAVPAVLIPTLSSNDRDGNGDAKAEKGLGRDRGCGRKL